MLHQRSGISNLYELPKNSRQQSLETVLKYVNVINVC